MHTAESDFRLYDDSDLKTYLLMGWFGPDALAVCRARRDLPVGFLLLRYMYSVSFTVEPLSLLYLLVISIYVLGDGALISLGSFMQTKYLYVLIHI